MTVHIAYPAAEPLELKDVLVARIFGDVEALKMHEMPSGWQFGSASRKMANSGRDLEITVSVTSPRGSETSDERGLVGWVQIGARVTAARNSASYQEARTFLEDLAAQTGGFVQTASSYEEDSIWQVPEKIVPMKGLDQRVADWMLLFGPQHAEAFAAVLAKGWDIVPRVRQS